MRTLQNLIELYPDKTGKEILEIQEQDKIEDELEFQKINESRIKWVEDINTNGGIFRGVFGYGQRFFYKVSNVGLDDMGRIMCDVEEIVVFFGHKNGVVKEGEMNFEKKKKEYTKAEPYAFNSYDRVSEKEWDEVNSYLEGLSKFW